MSPSTVTLMGMIARIGVGRGIHAPALKMTRWMRVTLTRYSRQEACCVRSTSLASSTLSQASRQFCILWALVSHDAGKLSAGTASPPEDRQVDARIGKSVEATQCQDASEPRADSYRQLVDAGAFALLVVV